MQIIKPQPGPQEQFLKCKADICFYGGMAGGGKTWSLIMEPLRHTHVRGFTALTFRRSGVEVRSPGGLWDASQALYNQLPEKTRPTPREQQLDWKFPAGSLIKFAHLMNDNTVYEYQGTEICYLAFDEITHFSFKQFSYLLTRNRSTCGVKPYVRATCNPDADSWVRKFIAWWIDDNTGLVIPERIGIIRYFLVLDDKIIWAEEMEELFVHYSPEELEAGAKPKSFTFIPASIYDNKELLSKDPNYLSALKSQNKVERERLLGGNWNISYNDFGSVLNRNDFSRYDYLSDHKGEQIFPTFEKTYLVVDGASKTKEANDYSVIGLFGKCKHDNNYYIIDWFRGKLEAHDLEQKLIDMWYKWHPKLSMQGIWIEDASVGITLIQNIKRKGIPVFPLLPIKDKFLRLNDSLGTIKSRFVHIPAQSSWGDKFIEECEAFRADLKHVIMDGEKVGHDDQVDVLAYATGNQITLENQVTVYKKPDPRKRRISPVWST